MKYAIMKLIKIENLLLRSLKKTEGVKVNPIYSVDCLSEYYAMFNQNVK